MAAFRLCVVFCVLVLLPLCTICLPEPGKVLMKFDKKTMFHGFPKSLYKGAIVSVKGRCTYRGEKMPVIHIEWRLKYSQCAEIFIGLKDSQYASVWGYQRNHELTGSEVKECKTQFLLQDFSSAEERIELPSNSTALPSTVSKEFKKSDENTSIVPSKDSKKDKHGAIKPKTGIATEKDNNQTEERRQRKRHEGIEAKEKILKHVKRSVEPDEPDDTVGSNKPLLNTNSKNPSGSRFDVESSIPNEQLQGDANRPAETLEEMAGNNPDQEDSISRKSKSGNAVVSKKVQTKLKKLGPPKTKPRQVKPSKKKTGLGKGNVTDKKEDEKSMTKGKGKGKAKQTTDKQTTDKQTKKNPMAKGKNDNRVVTARRDGIYLLIVKAESVDDDVDFHLELEVSMESKTGFLSAADWALLPFYGVMSLVYLFYGVIWLIVSACQWRDLLRIQFWIGGVIALGMLEKAVFYSEYNNINHTGEPSSSLVIFAELVSVLKRTLARMLVIIVSMGFGIVKPRLGSSLHRVLGVGGLYFILGSIEGCFRSLSHKADPSKQQLIAGIPLAVLDAAICWWIFMSLVQTTRTLRIRRNLVKLSLYRHFTNTLVFAVLASVAYMIWSIKTHKFADCIKDWSELWLDDAFWHFLFSIILLVIMILWRPTANNQRYAFTPLVDFGDDEDEDNMTLSEAFEGMKMRNSTKGNTTDVYINGEPRKKADDDLKWVEENIPTSAADTVLPSVLDSDEELMTTKFEMSKME